MLSRIMLQAARGQARIGTPNDAKQRGHIQPDVTVTVQNLKSLFPNFSDLLVNLSVAGCIVPGTRAVWCITWSRGHRRTFPNRRSWRGNSKSVAARYSNGRGEGLQCWIPER